MVLYNVNGLENLTLKRCHLFPNGSIIHAIAARFFWWKLAC